jgi:hypothetical protein
MFSVASSCVTSQGVEVGLRVVDRLLDRAEHARTSFALACAASSSYPTWRVWIGLLLHPPAGDGARLSAAAFAAS